MTLVVTLIIALACGLLHGACLVPLWRWFVVPLGVPPIGFLQAAGLAIIIGTLTAQSIPRPELSDKVEAIASEFLRPVFGLAMGWVIHMLMH